jgi:ferredoxin
MIVGKLKPMQEIVDSISEFHKVLILGCGTCVTVCLTGGDKEAHVLSRDLADGGYFKENPPTFTVDTIERQCEWDLVKTYLHIPPDTDAVLSLACGAGVQTVADVLKTLPVIPALNTTFLGALDEPGIWREKCYGCGECVLAYTGGICPVSRCAKRLFNGPCGGSTGGKCEINQELDCAWHLIIERLKALGRLDDYDKIHPAKDWSAGRAGGPRSMERIAPIEMNL